MLFQPRFQVGFVDQRHLALASALQPRASPFQQRWDGNSIFGFDVTNGEAALWALSPFVFGVKTRRVDEMPLGDPLDRYSGLLGKLPESSVVHLERAL
jgi:hypothetical protein